MGLDSLKKSVRAGIAALVTLGPPGDARATPPPHPQETASTLLHQVQSPDQIRRGEARQLRDRAEALLDELRAARLRDITPQEEQKLKEEFFNAGRDYGAALRRFKDAHGYAHPDFFRTPRTEELYRRVEEAEARLPNLTPAERIKVAQEMQQLLEEYLEQDQREPNFPIDALPGMRGQYCGMYPILCSPTM